MSIRMPPGHEQPMSDSHLANRAREAAQSLRDAVQACRSAGLTVETTDLSHFITHGFVPERGGPNGIAIYRSI